jgi:hypothetical protein
VGTVSVAIQNVKDVRKEAFKFVTTVGAYKSDSVCMHEEMVARSVMSDDKEIRIDATVSEVAATTTAEEEESNTVEQTEGEPSEKEKLPISSSSITITYRATLDISSLPTDTFLQTELDAFSLLNEQDKVVLVVKVAFSPLADLIASKRSELDQIYKDMEVVKEAIKSRPGGSSFTAPTKSNSKSGSTTRTKKSTEKGTKKGGKKSSASSSSAAAADTAESEVSMASNLMSMVASNLVVGGALAVKHYSVPLFAAATAAIYYYGEYASV